MNRTQSLSISSTLSASAREMNEDLGLLCGTPKWQGRAILSVTRTKMALIKTVEEMCYWTYGCAMATEKGQGLKKRVQDLTKIPSPYLLLQSSPTLKKACTYASKIPARVVSSVLPSTETVVNLRTKLGKRYVEGDPNELLRAAIQASCNFDDRSLHAAEIVGARPFTEQLVSLAAKGAGRMVVGTINDVVANTQVQQAALIRALEKAAYRKLLDGFQAWLLNRPKEVLMNVGRDQLYRMFVTEYLQLDAAGYLGNLLIKNPIQAVFELITPGNCLSAGVRTLGLMMGSVAAQILVQPITLASEWGPAGVKAYRETLQDLDQRGAAYWTLLAADPSGYLSNLWRGESLDGWQQVQEDQDVDLVREVVASNIAAGALFNFLDKVCEKGAGIKGLLGLAISEIVEKARSGGATSSSYVPPSPEMQELSQVLKSLGLALAKEVFKGVSRQTILEAKRNLADSKQVVATAVAAHAEQYPYGVLIGSLIKLKQLTIG